MLLKNEIKTKEKDLEIANSKIIQANLDAGTYKDINIFLENKLKEMEQKFEDKFKNNENEIVNLKKEVTAQNLEISDLKNENSNLKNEVTAQNLEISDLKNENSNLKKEVTAQNLEISDLKNENFNLKKVANAQNNEISNLKKEVTAQNLAISDLKNENENCKKANMTQNETISLQDNTIQLLKEQNNALFEMENQDREWIRILRDSFYQLDYDYNDLNNTVEGLNYSLQQIITSNFNLPSL